MQNILLIVGFIIVGIVLKRLNLLPQTATFKLNQLVINLLLPAVILLNLPKVTFSSQLLFCVLAAWGCIALSAIIVLGLSKLFAWSKPITAALLVTTALGNTSYLGFPLIQLFYGEQGLSVAIIYDQIGSFLGLALYASFIISVYQETEQKVNFGQIIKRVLSFPPFIALLAALLLPVTALPEFIQNLFKLLALLMVPTTMIIVGLQFQLRLERALIKPVAIGLTLKMLLVPFIVWLVAIATQVDSNILKVSVMEAAMPPMVTAAVMAINANLAPKLSAAMIGLGLLLASISLPAWHFVLELS